VDQQVGCVCRCCSGIQTTNQAHRCVIPSFSYSKIPTYPRHLFRTPDHRSCIRRGMPSQWRQVGGWNNPGPAHRHWTARLRRPNISTYSLAFLHEIGLKEYYGQNIHQMHRDHVPAVPPGFHLLGSTPIDHVQGMVKLFPSSTRDKSTTADSIKRTDIHILTVQGHPEFTVPISEALITARLSTGILDAPTAEDARGRASWRNDGPGVVGKTVFAMLGVPC
jgi:hypothetical protein